MTAVEQHVRAVASGGRGRRTAAFFDLDGTLVEGYTAGAFYRDRLRRGDVGPGELVRAVAIAADSAVGGESSRLGPIAVAGLRGQRRADLEAIGDRVFSEHIAAAVRSELRALVEAHRARGHTVALATSATRFQAEPVARDLAIDHVLCSEVVAKQGVLTGEFDGGMLWGEAKAAAVRDFAQAEDVDLAKSYAYGNGDEDVAFLAAVGRPRAVDPQPLLERVARREGWPIVDVEREPSGRLRRLAGTVAAAGGMNAALALGWGVGKVTGDRRAGANAASAFAFDVALGLAGVRLRVVGAEHLAAPRPAVFVFNHQSNLDPIVAGALLRQDFTATGKQEAKSDPVAALAGHVLDAVYLDRDDGERAKAQLAALDGRLADGISVLIAPEGTRSKTAEPSRFKLGAFHLAARTGVPIIPIVLRNTGELMPPGAKLISPGVIDVCVLEPLNTTGWERSELGTHAENLRQRIGATVADWPAAA